MSFIRFPDSLHRTEMSFSGLQFSSSCIPALKIAVALETSQSSGVKVALREVV